MARNNSGNAAVKSAVLCSSKATVRVVGAENNSASPVWLHVFDAVSLPANGTVPDFSRILAANSSGELSFGDGEYFQNGLVAALSSTAYQLTLIGAAAAWFHVSFKG